MPLGLAVSKYRSAPLEEHRIDTPGVAGSNPVAANHKQPRTTTNLDAPNFAVQTTLKTLNTTNLLPYVLSVIVFKYNDTHLYIL
jgi:hypothetical protein